MKQVVLLLVILCFSMETSADDDQYYIIYDQNPAVDRNNADNSSNGFAQQDYSYESNNISKTNIEDDLDIMKNDIRSSKNKMYNEIRRFKYGF